MQGIWTMGELLVEIMRPEPDMPLHETGSFLGPFPSGAPAIFIDTVARLGHPAGIIGGVGDDDFGRCILDRLERDGVDCSLVTRFEQGTTAVAFVTYFADGSRKFIYHFNDTPAVWARRPRDRELDPEFFHVMGCSLMPNPDFRAEILSTARALRKKGARVSFDPNVRPELMEESKMKALLDEVLGISSILLPGEAELEIITGSRDEAGAADLFARYDLELVVLKRGKRGCTVFSREESFDVAAYPVQEVDPTGAGDCFDAGFLCGLREDRPLEECAGIAAVSGALNAAAFGPMEGAISRGEVIARIQSFSS
jgi:sugar/nucleoside kinase (ribokinase family)